NPFRAMTTYRIDRLLSCINLLSAIKSRQSKKPGAIMKNQETYPITIAGVERNLPLFEVKPGLRIAILNILGDVELVDACALELNRLLADTDYDVIITPEAKSIPLAHMLSKVSGKPYIVRSEEHTSELQS